MYTYQTQFTLKALASLDLRLNVIKKTTTIIRISIHMDTEYPKLIFGTCVVSSYRSKSYIF